MIKVAIFEDNHNYRVGHYQLVNGSDGFQCIGSFEDCSNLLEKMKKIEPDIVLMDIEMPGMNGIEAVRILRKENPDLKIMMQTNLRRMKKYFNPSLLGLPGIF